MKHLLRRQDQYVQVFLLPQRTVISPQTQVKSCILGSYFITAVYIPKCDINYDIYLRQSAELFCHVHITGFLEHFDDLCRAISQIVCAEPRTLSYRKRINYCGYVFTFVLIRGAIFEIRSTLATNVFKSPPDD